MAFPIIPKRRSGATGNPASLQVGELAVNTLTGELFLGGDSAVMLLNPPTSAGTTVTEHTGDGTTVAFTFSGYNGTADGGYLVSVGGIDQPPSKYAVTSTAGGTITFVEAPVAGELISIRAIVAGGGGGGGGITELTGDVTASGTGSVAATLASVTTAQSGVGSATAIPVLSVDEKGRVTALSTVAMAALTTTQIAGLATTAPAALATAAVVGLSTFAARADHQHAFPTAAQVGALGATAAAGGDLAGNYPSPTLAAITTAQANVGSATAIPVISTDAKGRVTALSTTGFSALTTNQIAGLATTAPAALTTAPVVGLSTFAARADHQHLMPSASDVGALGATASAGGDLTGTYPNPTLAAITTAQNNVGSSTVVPVISVDAKGRVVALSSTSINAGGGFTVASTQAASLTVDSTYSQKIIPFQASSPVALTLPNDANANISSGSKIQLVNLTTQEVRVLAGTGATVLNALPGGGLPALASQNQLGTATKLAANTWVLDGNFNYSSVADPFFSNVSLLLHMNGVDGGTSFPDNSLNNYAVTVASPGTTSTAQFRFGTASFLPAGGWLTAHTDNTPFAFGEGDFTIEFWLRLTATGGAQRLVNISGTTNYIRTNTSSAIVYATSSVVRITSGAIGTNTWAHIAVSRVQGITRMFINGFAVITTFIDPTNYTAAGPLTQIGGEPSTGTSGNIDEFRVTKGVGRYVSNFTAPVAQFPDL